MGFYTEFFGSTEKGNLSEQYKSIFESRDNDELYYLEWIIQYKGEIQPITREALDERLANWNSDNDSSDGVRAKLFCVVEGNFTDAVRRKVSREAQLLNDHLDTEKKIEDATHDVVFAKYTKPEVCVKCERCKTEVRLRMMGECPDCKAVPKCVADTIAADATVQRLERELKGILRAMETVRTEIERDGCTRRLCLAGMYHE